jgi:hypothetical protein
LTELSRLYGADGWLGATTPLKTDEP